ncbi:histone-lysine N-methyltransferase PRDM9-like [Lineus longissimus]|uniref:histone-lysine N-methyltransferase PRDM9-like n=1 Tax=Lineus longissimus TaxID=88925 RepID=UPI00315CD909
MARAVFLQSSTPRTAKEITTSGHDKQSDADSSITGTKRRLAFGSGKTRSKKLPSFATFFSDFYPADTPKFDLIFGEDERRELQNDIVDTTEESSQTLKTYFDETTSDTWEVDDESPPKNILPVNAESAIDASQRTSEWVTSVTMSFRACLIEPYPNLSSVRKTSKLSAVPVIPKNDTRRASYNFHGLVMSGRKEKQENMSYQCRICRRDFTSRIGLQNHSRVHSVQGNQYECKKCQTIFATKTKLTAHLKLHRPLPYSHCSKCENPLTMSDEHGLQPHFCPICGLSFVAKDCLLQHINHLHPQYCPLCAVPIAWLGPHKHTN